MPIISNQASANYTNNTKDYTALSNTLNINILNPSLSLVKSSNKSNAVIGETITFTIVVSNTDISLSLSNVIVTDDLLSAGLTYVPNTCKVNGISVTDSPQTGINIGIILPITTKTITFDATVNG